jgi:NADPH:quinone reductase-like Zn-dependent oxidoreductase
MRLEEGDQRVAQLRPGLQLKARRLDHEMRLPTIFAHPARVRWLECGVFRADDFCLGISAEHVKPRSNQRRTLWCRSAGPHHHDRRPRRSHLFLSIEMRQVVLTRFGPPEVLQLREAPEPVPGSGEIRIAVRAIGVNFVDVLARIGVYPDAPKPPSVLGYEVAGIVDAVGDGVAAPRVGDRVLAFTRFGGYAARVVVPADVSSLVPARLSDAEAAAIPVSYLTAAIALKRQANLQPGETVLIHNAGGGTGIAAVQLAKRGGAIVLGTASPGKHAALRTLGVDHAIDYRTGDVAAEVRRLTGGRGADVILDPLSGRSWRQSYRLLAPLGRLILYGASQVVTGERRSWWRFITLLLEMPRFHPLALLNDNRSVHGLNLGRLWSEVPRLRPEMDALLADLAAGLLQPVVAQTFPLERAAEAHRYMQSRGNIGKVVLTIG